MAPQVGFEPTTLRLTALSSPRSPPKPNHNGQQNTWGLEFILGINWEFPTAVFGQNSDIPYRVMLLGFSEFRNVSILDAARSCSPTPMSRAASCNFDKTAVLSFS